jgi:hypothetical protein
VLIEVSAPDETPIYREAFEWSDPDRGILTVMAPPVGQRLSDLLAPALDGLGACPLVRPASGEAQAVENGLVRLRSHGIGLIVLLQTRWIPRDVLATLVGLCEAAAIDVAAVVHPDSDLSSAVRDWRAVRWGWADLRAHVHARQAAHDWTELPAVHQRVPLPALGLRGPSDIPAAPPTTRAARVAFTAVRRQVGTAPSPGGMASAVRHALLACSPETRTAALDGAAAAAADSGYVLLSDAATSEAELPVWRDLRTIPETGVAAALTLLALGLGTVATARLDVADVSADGAHVRVGQHVLGVPPEARPYVMAQRLVRAGMRGRYLQRAAEPLTPSGVRRLMIAGAQALGLELDPRDVDDGLTPSQRWLYARHLAVRRTLDADEPRQSRDEEAVASRRCRHGLTPLIEIGGVTLSHSGRLCASHHPEDVRPTSRGYAVALADELGPVARYAVARAGSPAGSLWRVRGRRGDVWLQSMAADPPSLAAIGAVVAAIPGPIYVLPVRRPSDRRPARPLPRGLCVVPESAGLAA